MEDNINYTELLALFVNDDEMREWQNVPFKIGDKVISTDSFAMAIIDSKLAPGVKDLIDYEPDNVLKVIPASGPSIGKIKIEDIRSLIKKCPKVPVTNTCEACEGEGEVEYSFEWEDKYFEKYCDCPICEGEGDIEVLPKKKEVDSSKKIKIGISHFTSKMIFRLGMACKITETEVIDIVYQTEVKSPTIFRLNNAELLMMPVSECEPEDFLGEIKIVQ